MTTCDLNSGLAYTAQVPGSRFCRFYGPWGASFVVEPYPLSILDGWLCRATLRRYGVPVVVGAIVYALWMSLGRTTFSAGGVVVGVVELAAMLATCHLGLWWYWRSGQTIRVEGDQLLVRTVNPLFTRSRRFGRDEIRSIVATGGRVLVRRKHGWTIDILGAGHRTDAGWLAAELRTQLELDPSDRGVP